MGLQWTKSFNAETNAFGSLIGNSYLVIIIDLSFSVRNSIWGSYFFDSKWHPASYYPSFSSLSCEPNLLPLFFHFLCFISCFWASHNYERLNYPLLRLGYQILFDVMIFTIYLMLFQYYCFLYKFIVLFMVWSPVHMYVIGF